MQHTLSGTVLSILSIFPHPPDSPSYDQAYSINLSPWQTSNQSNMFRSSGSWALSGERKHDRWDFVVPFPGTPMFPALN